jgi:hypothetical protein
VRHLVSKRVGRVGVALASRAESPSFLASSLNQKVVSLESTFEKKEEELKAGQMAVPLHQAWGVWECREVPRLGPAQGIES